MAKAGPMYCSCYRAFVATVMIWCCSSPPRVAPTRYMPVGLNTDRVHVLTTADSIVAEYFISTLELNVTSVGVCDNPWNSCVGRCTDTPVPGFYTCFCDALCRRYGDCCLDYDRHCSVSDEEDISGGRLNTDKSYFACIRPDLESRSTFGMLMVDRCPQDYRAHNSTRDLCEQSGDMWPVTSGFGDVFRNVHCAECHHMRNVIPWKKRASCESMESCYLEFVPPLDLPTPRPCLFHVGRCKDPDAPASLQEACGAYSGSVFRVSGDFDKHDPRSVAGAVNSTAYKNFHCAQCSGEQVKSLMCPAWYLSATYINREQSVRSLQPSFRNDISDTSAMIINLLLFVETVRSGNLPAAFSVLFNFDLDGENVMFNTQDSAWWAATQEYCQDDELWDPFLNQCRPLMCGAEYDLIDYQCVEKNSSSTYNSTLTANSDTANSVLRMDTSSVLITLDLDLIAFGDNNLETVSKALQEDLLDMLARSLDLSSARFTNYTLQELDEMPQWSSNGPLISRVQESTTSYSEMMGTVSFVFSGCENRTEPSIAMVLSTLSLGVSSNKILMYIGTNNSIIARAVGIQEVAAQKSDNSLNWCTQGLVREYVNEPFNITMRMNGDDGDVTALLYMQSTGQYYNQGEFLMSTLYQGSSDRSVTNGSTCILTCENLPPSNCSSNVYVALLPWEYSILANGTILYVGNSTVLHETYEPQEYQCNHGVISVCFHPEDIAIEPDPGYDWDSAYPLRIIGTVLLGLSVAGVLATLVSYSLFEQLRNLPGANMINLALCIMAFQITFLAGMRESVDNAACLYVAISLHYEILALFCWANVMAIDMHSTFGTRKIQSTTRTKAKYLPRYMVYAYGAPALIVSVCCFFNFCECVDGVVIGYAKSNICWITEGKALALAFALPLGLILAVNFLLFGLTIRRMRRNKKERRKQKIFTKKTRRRQDVQIYARMSSVMCFTWVFGFAMAIEANPPWLFHTFEILFVLTNTIQGLLICLAFVCNSRVLDLYRELLQKCCRNATRASNQPKENSTAPGLRTLSTETFVSTISLPSSQDGQ